MSEFAIATPKPVSSAKAVASRLLVVWLVPVLYPACLSAIFGSAEIARDNAALGGVLLALALAWGIAGPFLGWLALNYLDRNGFERSQNRLVVHGALLTAVTPPLFSAVRQYSYIQSTNLAWYLAIIVIAVAAFAPASESVASASTTKFRYVHASSAVLLVTFAVVHVFNHTLAFINIPTHAAVLHVLRMVYRQQLIEKVLLAAVAAQVCTGLIMVSKSYLRRGNPLRNAQLLSGLYLAFFLATHVIAPFKARHRGIDSDFVWAAALPDGLLGKLFSVSQLPRYSLAVVAISIHLGVQARWNLARIIPASAARKVSYGVMGIGVAAALVIALAACGVHLVK